MRLTNNNLLLAVVERVLWHLEVELSSQHSALHHPTTHRSGTTPDATRNVVVRTVARAEPSTKVTSLTNGHTTQVGADTDHYEPEVSRFSSVENSPLGPLHTLVIRLGVTKGLDVYLVGLVNLASGTVADEHGLSTPLDDNRTT